MTLPGLPTARLQSLAARYSTSAAAWRSSPRIAATMATIARLERQARDLAETLGELRSAELGVIGLPADDAGATLEQLDRLGERCAQALADLHHRGAARGGARPLAALYRSPPKFELAIAVRRELAGFGVVPTRSALCEALAEVLQLVGEDPSGLEDLVRRLPRPTAEPEVDCLGSSLAQ